jgi:lipopolysaccharide transport system ATP-binding protein
MKRREINANFDNIVAFAELDKFIDTPIKYYSSGMQVRLAFAIAAHLESEILLVDEVLAVGDAVFQKRCLGKMENISKEGRTVLFVSHNMHAVSLLCPKSILVENGNIVIQGPTTQVISQYLSSKINQSSQVQWSFAEAPGTERVKLHAVRALNPEGEACVDMNIDQPITLEVEFWILRKTRMTPSFGIYNQQGLLLFALANLHDKTWGNMEYVPGLYKCSCCIPGNYLNEGQHFVSINFSSNNNAYLVEIIRNEVIGFRVVDTGASRGEYVGVWVGLVRPLIPWSGARIGDLP